MKNRRLWLVLAALVFAATAFAVALPSTVAFIANRANTVHNTFRVEYLPPKDITVPVHTYKTVLCRGNEEISPAGFSFRLMNLDTGEVTSMTSFTDGWATTILTFTADDVGKTYHYSLYEVDTGRQDMTYDETVYTLTISLALDETHEMVASATLNGEPVQDIIAEFVNFYNPYEIPGTGDSNQPMIWMALLLISSIGVALLCTKEAIRRR